MRTPNRVLITGGAGFIGSHLAEALVAGGHEIVVLDDLSTGRLENLTGLLDSPALRFVQGTVTDAGVVQDLMSNVDCCAHLASAVGVGLIVREPLESLRGNVLGTDVVMTCAADQGRRLLFTSTSEVYGKSSAEPLDEHADRILGSPFKSRWAYAIAKGYGEALAHGLYRDRGAEVVVARLFNTVGARQSGAYGMVLPRLVRQALRRQDLTVYGDGTQTRCFAHVLDTVQALLLLLEHPHAAGKVFNVGSQVETPIVELARRVIHRSGSDSRVRLVPYEEAYGEGFEELGRRIPDTAAIRELTAWRARRTIDHAIDDVIAHEEPLVTRSEVRDAR